MSLVAAKTLLATDEHRSTQLGKRFLIHLRRALQKGKLQFHGELKSLAPPAAFGSLCRKAGQMEWVVYAKRPFGGPEQVLKPSHLADSKTGYGDLFGVFLATAHCANRFHMMSQGFQLNISI